MTSSSSAHSVSLFETATGKWWLPDDVPGDVVIQAMRAGAIFEPEIVAVAERSIRPGSVVLDVGANFGQMAVIFSRLVGPSGTVHAFEADETVFRLLQDNLRENGCDNVVAHHGAVWHEDGHALFYPEPDFRRFGSFGSYGIDPRAQAGRTVASLTIDGLGIEGDVSFMKVDVQGSDLFALQGARRLIARTRPVIVFEYEHQFQAEFATGFVDYENLVHQIGYRVTEVVGGMNYVIAPRRTTTRLLLVSHRGERCGVQQYGRRLFALMQSSGTVEWGYAECDGVDAFLREVASWRPDAVVLNYHPATLGWAVDPRVRGTGLPCFAIYHETWQATIDRAGGELADYLLCPDPTLLPRNPRAVPVPRFTPEPPPDGAPPPGVFTVGSFGFATPGKGFETLCALVDAECDVAQIRLNLPPHDVASIVSAPALDAVVAACQASITKPGITLEVTHDFLDDAALLDFLSRNTLNAFLYEDSSRGISSCTDYALASGRPLAVSRSAMFRHLHGISPSICSPQRSLRDIAAAGTAPLRNHVAQYAPAAARAAWNHAILQTLDLHDLCRSVPDGRGFNKILDDRSRLTYVRALDDLARHAPGMLARKIARANIQQAFALDTAERLIARYPEPRILAVGSYEDTTVAVLRAKGYRLDEVDPNVNHMNLAAFAASPQAIAQSYDVILCVSVLEHVADDQGFVRTVADLLAPGGVAIFTLDFSNHYAVTGRKPDLDERLYTTSDLVDRLMPCLPDCGLLDLPTWHDGGDDFTYDGCDYAFASWVFRKFDQLTLRHALPELVAMRTPPTPAGLIERLGSHGAVDHGLHTVIGREEIEADTRVFTCDGSSRGFLAFGPYCACPPGWYECAFLIRVGAADSPPDLEILEIDTVLDGAVQAGRRRCRYGEFVPGEFVIVDFIFEVPPGASALETRLLLTSAVPVTLVASVALRRNHPSVLRRKTVPGRKISMASEISAFDVQVYRGYAAPDVALLAAFRDPNAKAENGFIVEFTGARTRIGAVWDEAKSFHGVVLGLPVPVDFHAETPEWVGVIKSVATAEDRFVAMELGAGYGSWVVGSAVAARLRGISDIRLCAIEGDRHHFEEMQQHFRDNGFDPAEHTLLNAAVGTAASTAQWPSVDNSNSGEWGLRPIAENETDYIGRTFEHMVDVDVMALADLLRREHRWDLLHIDVQGHEVALCRSCLEELDARVRWIVVGTHSRKIEGDMIEMMTQAGWILEHEKPAIFAFSPNPSSLEAMTLLDGTQVWRNPRLTSGATMTTPQLAELPGDGPARFRKLNYGCGYDRREGYLNVDMDPNCAPDLLIRNMDFSMIPKHHFEEICALDVLEHIHRADTLAALLDWAEFLQLDGKLTLQTSSIMGVARLIEQTSSYAEQHGLTIFLYGNQAHEGDFHHTGFTEVTLKTHLVAAGFAPSEIITRDRWLFYTETRKVYDWTELASRAYLSSQQFVTEAYRAALGREADPEGRAFLMDRLLSGSWTRRDALRHVFSSPERLFCAAGRIGL